VGKGRLIKKPAPSLVRTVGTRVLADLVFCRVFILDSI
jgi:hypothetical protein